MGGLRTCPRSHQHIVGSRLLGTLLSLSGPALDPSRSHQHSQNPHTGAHVHSTILKDTWARWASWMEAVPRALVIRVDGGFQKGFEGVYSDLP